MPSISLAYIWAIAKCNDPDVGYSQTYRNQQTVSGITYYDCSSFVWYALKAGGYPMEQAYSAVVEQYSGNAFVTGNMDAVLTYLGFTRYNPRTTPWANGDIMWKSTHTEMVYDATNYICMGAHNSSVPLADQVSIDTWNSRDNWTYGYRNPGGIVVDYPWHAQATGGYTRNSQEAYENALLTYGCLLDKGWTLNAICGLLGNIEMESGYNPWRWYQDNIGTPTSQRAYGLVQFNPASKYIGDVNAMQSTYYAPNYINNAGLPHDGQSQLEFVDAYGDYLPSQTYPMTFADYKVSTLSAGDLAVVWLHNYERPVPITPQMENDRRTCAEYWFSTLGGVTPPTPTPTPKKSKMPMWMMISPF